MKRFVIFLTIVTFLCSIAVKADAQAYSLDNSFSTQFEFDKFKIAHLNGVNELPNGDIFVFGSFNSWRIAPQHHNLIKLSKHGNHYAGFTLNPPVLGSSVSWMLNIPQGFLINKGGSGIRKIDQLGNEIDPQWHWNIRTDLSPSAWYKPIYYPDGSMLWPFNSRRRNTEPAGPTEPIVKVKPDGRYDMDFGHQVDDVVWAVFPYDSNRVFVSGRFIKYDKENRPILVRIFNDGMIDTSFTGIFRHVGPTLWSSISKIHVQTDGKIIAIGRFRIYNIPDTLEMIRLNANGSLDSSFNNYNSVDGDGEYQRREYISSICSTPDGGYLVGGSFNLYQGFRRTCIVKVNGDGFIDTLHFNGIVIDSVDAWTTSHFGFPPGISSITRSKIKDAYYITGLFAKYQGQIVKPVIRIHGLSVGIEAHDRTVEVSIAPNPFPDFTSISLISKIEAEHLRVYDLMGKEIKAYQPSTRNRFTVDRVGMAPGIYIFRIFSTDRSVLGAGKLIVE